MTATQAPTPGPLSGDDVKLLVKLLDTLKPFAEVAEKLKHCHVVEICEPSPDNPSRNIIPMPREWFERAGDDLEYIAIQLHASGVLSEGQASKITGLDRVSVRREIDRLAPTAPVEASGSELHPATADLVDRFAAELKSKLAKAESKYGYRDEWLKPDWQDELTKSLAEHIQKGDPRDVAAYCAFAWHHEWSVTPNINWKAEWEAVCSARIADRDRSQEIINERDAWIAELLQQAKVTTPARAEAQDEGAAGEASAYRVRMISDDPAEWVLMHPEKALDFLSRKGWESQPLYAHPSPTPAADADRVRIAVEAFNAKINAPLTGPTHGAWDRGRIAGLKEALAALKSTAAKEGGEG